MHREWKGPSPRIDWLALYREHVDAVARAVENALELHNRAAASTPRGREFSGVVFHAGSRETYHADDLVVPFRTLPHFARFAPVPGPDHLLAFRPGERARLVRVVPSDYWEEPPARPDHPFEEVLDVREAPSLDAAAVVLGAVDGSAYVGNAPEVASRLGLAADAVEPKSLLAPLDWHRGRKTAYEVACIREAAVRAAAGHAAARRGFERGASEREIHADYLAASGQLDGETPYPNIVAWDDRSSVLHYQAKRTRSPAPGHTFLIDAGATVHGYASDITRTYARPGTHALFREALDRMDALQRRIASRVAPGLQYEELHADAVRGVAEILVEIGVLRVGVDRAIERGLALPFLPHGLGHHLGLQVHDVGGQQVSPEGRHRSPSPLYPMLRTTRDLEAGHVVTVEPGLYFIPLLLSPHREGPDASSFDWDVVDQLLPCGGIRVEDDVLVTEAGHENLTRGCVPGHLDPARESARA